MSWATVRAALVSRLAAIDGVENVHGQVRYLDEAVDDARFEALFKASGGVHFWMFTRTNRTERVSPDNSQITKVHHTVLLRGMVLFTDDGTGSSNSEDSFQDLVDDLAQEFRDGFEDGERTLGGIAISYTLPDFLVRLAEFDEHYLVNEAEATFRVEENI